jgi:glycosyltransferase involved in cell wall biosynthesis
MRIGLDVTMLARPCTGVENYLRALATHLPHADKDLEVVFLSAHRIHAKLDGPVLASDKPRSYALWRQIELPRLLRRNGVALFHSPLTAVPVGWSGPVVTTVHDLTWVMYPKAYSLRRRVGHRFWSALSVRKSARIIVPSQATANALASLHPRYASEKLVVIPECLPRQPTSYDNADAENLLRKLGTEPPFVLAVGTLVPRKNYERLIAAFERLSVLGANQHQLVIVGRNDCGAHQVHTAWQRSKCAREIRIVGYVVDRELDLLYRRAAAFVFPSLCEGFGLPLLEAMAAGVPIAASATSSLPEVGGEAACYFDPTNVEDMSRVLYRLLTDEKLRAELIRKGQERVKLFTPQAMAAKTVALYREVLSA